MSKKKGGFGKLLAGLAIGAGIGVLFAPKKGEETRKELKEKFDEMTKKVREIDAEEVKAEFEIKLVQIQTELDDLDKEKVLKIAKMVAAGANVIEVGGQTTKPGGFKEVDPEEEIARIMPAIQLLRENYPQIAIAVDTYKLPVMAAAIKAGVDIINDVQAFNSKQKLILMAKANVGMVTMHSSRTHDYDNLTVAMQKFFEHNLGTIAAAGIDLERVILDQGIGYAKVADGYQDYAMMRNIDQLNYLQRPIMVAISRKGFGQKLFNLAKEDRLGVTLIAETAMYLRGGRVLRVHDVEETSQLVKMIDTIENSYWFRSTSSQSQRQ